MKPDIVAFLKKRANCAENAIPALGSATPPLSPAQARLWVAEQLDPRSAHHIPFVLQADGPLDLAAVENGLSQLMQRHSVLRLRVDGADGQPTARISDVTFPPVALEGAEDWSDADLQSDIEAEIRRPFDLGQSPPLRLRILRQGPDRHLLIFTLHHLAADGSSVELLMRDFGAFYSEAVAGFAPKLPDMPIQYGDFAAWQIAPEQRAANDRHLPFWASQLADLPITRLPADHPRPALQDLSGAAVPIAIAPDTVATLRQLGQAEGATLFSVLFAAFNLLLHRYTGQRDVIVGTPSANRRHGETEPLVGLFVNPLPIRSQIDPTQSFLALLAQLHRTLLDAQDHQDLPFEHLVEQFQTDRDPGASPLFQIKFQLDRAPNQAMELPGLVLRRRPIPQVVARHDLSLNLVEGDQVTGQLDFATALYRPETAARIADHFVRLLERIAADPAAPVGQIDFLSDQERQDLLVTWNDTAVDFDPNQRLTQFFEAHAAARPEAVAVQHVAEGAEAQETYGALNARANRLAHALRADGIGPDHVVAIALDRGPDQIAAWLGVLKSGAAYLPLDPAYPAERLAYMLQDSGAALLLTNSDFSFDANVPRRELDQDWPAGPEIDPAPIGQPDDLAYVIYTSGSSGQPKGVEIPHRGLTNLVLDKLKTLQATAQSRVFGFFSFSFDASIPDMILSLCGGGCLITGAAEDVLPGPRMAAHMRDHRVTHLTITPSALAALPSDQLPDLRVVLVGGELPARDLIETWSQNRLFINAYGPTETSVNASMVACGNGHPLDPTLKAPANKQLHVLDGAGMLLPVGCPGELCIGGVGLARGYRGLPERTAQAFIPDPFAPAVIATDPSLDPIRPAPARLYRTGDLAVRDPDGRLRVLGRIDDQIKLRGFRIEPGEIARACRAQPGVADAVVQLREGRLVAYLVRDGQIDPPEAPLRDALKALLPRHMIPDGFVWLDRLPLTVNGKLDSRALPQPPATRATGRAPNSATERALAEIFGDILELSRPGVEADFFDLGGTSLMATRLVAAIEDRFGRRLQARDLFDGASIRALAARIEGQAETTGLPPWHGDLTLPADFPIAAPRALPDGRPQRIFMTGATGFVGSYLVAELLRAPDRQLLCLTRGGACALEQALRRQGLWQPDWAARLHPVEGDLARPGLGLSAADAARIRHEAHAILHCGAEVHHLRPYRALRPANVTGTLALLRLAAETGLALHHVSTLSALLPQEGPLPERARAADLRPPEGGYNQSKWVAEQLVAQAADRGLGVSLYRLGSVSGHSVTGRYNRADILCRQLQGYLAAGLAPEGQALINLLPVDHVAQAICQLIDQPPQGRAYHLTHSRPVGADLLFDAIAAEGHELRRIPAQEWQELLARIARHSPDHPLYPLASLGSAQAYSGRVWPYSCTETRAALHSLPEPAITAALLRPTIAAIAADLARRPPKVT